MEGIKGSSLVGETTTVVAAVITITTTGNTTMVTAVDSQMEVDASVTTDYPSETSMGP